MNRRALILELLRAAGEAGVTTSQLLEAGAGSRYGARLLELRKQGHVIETKRVREGSWRYTLTRDVPPPVDIAPTEQRLFLAPPPAPADALCWDGAA